MRTAWERSNAKTSSRSTWKRIGFPAAVVALAVSLSACTSLIQHVSGTQNAQVAKCLGAGVTVFPVNYYPPTNLRSCLVKLLVNNNRTVISQSSIADLGFNCKHNQSRVTCKLFVEQRFHGIGGLFSRAPEYNWRRSYLTYVYSYKGPLEISVEETNGNSSNNDVFSFSSGNILGKRSL